jgi:hypothetical protein
MAFAQDARLGRGYGEKGPGAGEGPWHATNVTCLWTLSQAQQNNGGSEGPIFLLSRAAQLPRESPSVTGPPDHRTGFVFITGPGPQRDFGPRPNDPRTLTGPRDFSFLN